MNWGPGTDALTAVVREELAAGKGLVLDFGCGRGALSQTFEAADYVGFDIIPSFVAFAHQRNIKHKFTLMDGTRLAFRPNEFDRVVIVGVLHHLNDGLTSQALAEIRRVLRSNGKCLIIEATPTKERRNVIGRLLRSMDAGAFIRPVSEWVELLEQHLQIERSYHVKSGWVDTQAFVLRGKEN
jgi:ubiquinone/menaquinone biosynthesis C-methylase UbiE